MKKKNIVLCSDGTGNSGGYGSDSNVYKTYKAVNNNMSNGIEQYTFYDQGVGTSKSETSKNKYTIALSGAFGFGFRNNVLHLYHALARCYEPGDALFLFGFSRGAATMRALTGFINACGLVDRHHSSVQIDGKFDGKKFKDRVEEAFTLYRDKDKNAQQKFKDQYAFKDDEYAPEGNLKIKFVGVWDTVSALGFPKDFSKLIEWFFEALDHFSDRFPYTAHNFYDYGLNNSIENAYHALAIDDERTTFHPKVWDEKEVEVWDGEKIKKIPFTGYVEQVWFAGVHSNVGGGYPRTGLSDVTLQWMLTKAQEHGLVLYPDRITEINDNANPYDKLYDSRDGVAVYYRYAPRNLVELCEREVVPGNKSVHESKLKGNIALHVSAYKKIQELSDGYAPDGIPLKFDVVDINRDDPKLAEVVKHVDMGQNKNQPLWVSLETDIKKIIAKRKLHYRVFVELTTAIILISGLFWVKPPESVMALNACEKKQFQTDQAQPQPNDFNALITRSFFVYEQNFGSTLDPDTAPDFCKKANKGLFKDVADITRYMTPVYFKNFVTYVMEVHSWIVVIMLSILFYLYQCRKDNANDLDDKCRQLNALLPDLNQQSEKEASK